MHRSCGRNGDPQSPFHCYWNFSAPETALVPVAKHAHSYYHSENGVRTGPLHGPHQGSTYPSVCDVGAAMHPVLRRHIAAVPVRSGTGLSIDRAVGCGRRVLFQREHDWSLAVGELRGPLCEISNGEFVLDLSVNPTKHETSSTQFQDGASSNDHCPASRVELTPGIMFPTRKKNHWTLPAVLISGCRARL